MSSTISYQLEANMSVSTLSKTIEVAHDCYQIEVQFDDIWSPPKSPKSTMPAREVDIKPTKVFTDIRTSIKNLDSAPIQGSGEFKNDPKVTKQDNKRIAKTERKWKKDKSPPPMLHQEDERDHERQEAQWKGRHFLLDFLRSHFPQHLDNITLRGTPTLEEIRFIGNEDLATGVRQCRRLFNAPVISDKVGSLLYQELRQGQALDHTHEVQYDPEAYGTCIPSKVIHRERTCGLEVPVTTRRGAPAYKRHEFSGLITKYSVEAPDPSLRRAHTTDLSEVMPQSTTATTTASKACTCGLLLAWRRVTMLIH
jgi:hypothetical protein